VNSRVANVATGPDGLENARRMGRAAALELGIDPGLVLVSSTGVIGVPLPIEKIEKGLVGMSSLLQSDPVLGAEGIMTTDTHPKALSLSIPLTGDGANGRSAVLTLVGKGSGMIAPNMATMLVYAFTDAVVDAPALDAMLRRIIDRTFNMLSVDSDMSTSDTCALLANGLAGAVDPQVFEEGLERASEAMTELLARDGEGATRLLRVSVRGALDTREARVVARSLVESPLIKTMVHGADPNAGRILMAVGKCIDCRVESHRIGATIGSLAVIVDGQRIPFDEAAVRRTLLADPVDIDVTLGVGDGCARAWGCDLSAGYIEENAAYYSS
jgi:glutamate N-acetyltransferase/amino-acid N-acetyltransferase